MSNTVKAKQLFIDDEKNKRTLKIMDVYFMVKHVIPSVRLQILVNRQYRK